MLADSLQGPYLYRLLHEYELIQVGSWIPLR